MTGLDPLRVPLRMLAAAAVARLRDDWDRCLLIALPVNNMLRASGVPALTYAAAHPLESPGQPAAAAEPLPIRSIDELAEIMGIAPAESFDGLTAAEILGDE